MSYHFVTATDTNVLKEIRIALSLRRCILMIGSSLSTQAFIEDNDYQPNWYNLLQKITDSGHEKGWIDIETATDIQALIQEGFLSEAGQEIEERLKEKPRLQTCLKEALSYEKVKTSEIHRLVAELPFRAYLTTNYDTLIEDAYFILKEQQRLTEYYEISIGQALTAFRDDQPFILKLHGGIEQPDTVTLSDRNFERRFHRASNYWRDLEKLLAISSVLFIGFGKADHHELIGFLNRIDVFNTSNKHWMVIPDAQLPKLEARRLQEHKGIHIIQYKDDTAHLELLDFLKELSASFSPARLASEQGERINRVADITEIQPASDQPFSDSKPPQASDNMPSQVGASSSPSQKTIRVFVSYAEKDEEYRGVLEKHLKLMGRRGLIQDWYVCKINAGIDLNVEINKHLSEADIILLLISVDLFYEESIYEDQIEQAIERHLAGKARVIPILLRKVDGWEDTPFGQFHLGRLTPLPKNRRFVISTDYPNQDEAFTEVARGIREVVDELTTRH